MTKTIWIDFDDKIVYQDEAELKADWEENSYAPTFSEWLDDNLISHDYWEAMSDEERANLKQEYKSCQQAWFKDWVEAIFETVEVRCG